MPISAMFKPLAILVFGKIIAIIGINTFAAKGLNTTAHLGKTVLPVTIGIAIAIVIIVYIDINATLNGKTSHNVKSIIFCGISDRVPAHSILHMYIRATHIT